MTATDMQRNDDGTLPAHAWPGCYPLAYLTESGLTVCATCANGDTSDPVTAQFVRWEGPVDWCDDCGCDMESAYGDPDVVDD